MKYLESFDVFGSGEYEKITRGKFSDITSKIKYDGVSESERLRLERLFKKIFDPSNKTPDWPKVQIYQTNTSEYYHSSINKDQVIFIFHYDDDWYFIEDYNQNTFDSYYYKCDGLDGVKQMLSDTLGVNEARLADLIKDLPKELNPPPTEPDVKLLSQHTCKQRWNGKKLLFKVKWYNTSEHDLTKRIAERSSFQSIKHFNEIFKRFLDKIFPSMIGKEILVSGRYSFYFEEYNVSIIIVIDVDGIMKNNNNEILVITILPGDVGIKVVKTIVISYL